MIKPFKPTPRPNPDTAYVPLRKQSPTQAPKMPVAPKAAAAAAAPSPAPAAPASAPVPVPAPVAPAAPAAPPSVPPQPRRYEERRDTQRHQGFTWGPVGALHFALVL